MKKSYLIVVTTLLAVVSVKAQDNSSTTKEHADGDYRNHRRRYVNDDDLRNRPVFGLKAGINYSNVYDSEGEDFEADSKVGFAGGLYLAIPVGEHFGVQPEVLFSQKGFKATGRLFGNTYSLTRTTNYIDIPLFFAAKPIRELTLLVGPQYSYLLSQTNKFENASTSIVQEQEFDNDNVRKNTLCFVGGLDINLDHLVLGARLGIDVQNNNGDGTSDTPRYKNLWSQFTVGYRFY